MNNPVSEPAGPPRLQVYLLEKFMSKNKGTGFWSVVQSVLAAGIGVQSKANKERDFKHGRPLHFIVGGIVGTLLFILALTLFVQYLIHG